MGRETSTLLPKHERLLADLGENLRLARLRRKLSAADVIRIEHMEMLKHVSRAVGLNS